MDLEKYPFIVNTENEVITYQFTSAGAKGEILKIVQFSQIEGDFYNLAFGDYCTKTNLLDDLSVSSNGDRDKVLATVANCVVEYSRLYPERKIYATGSTPSRTRLYQMGIAKYIQQIKEDFDVFGFHEGKWIPFQTKINFHSFLLSRKTNTFTKN